MVAETGTGPDLAALDPRLMAADVENVVTPEGVEPPTLSSED